jgi:hypothetical protein
VVVVAMPVVVVVMGRMRMLMCHFGAVIFIGYTKLSVKVRNSFAASAAIHQKSHENGLGKGDNP